jgi:DNA-directed RNA polymerase specialized sigma24 family protein
MTTYTIARTDEAIRNKAETATYLTYSRLQARGIDLTRADLEDMTQEAHLAYWNATQRQPEADTDTYHFSAACHAAARCYHRQIRARNPWCDTSLDNPTTPRHIEAQAIPWHDDPAAWLDDDQTRALLESTGKYTRPASARTLELDTAILRLLTQDYDNAALATALGVSQSTIRNRRRLLKERLKAILAARGQPIPEYRGTGGWRKAHAHREPNNQHTKGA